MNGYKVEVKYYAGDEIEFSTLFFHSKKEMKEFVEKSRANYFLNLDNEYRMFVIKEIFI